MLKTVLTPLLVVAAVGAVVFWKSANPRPPERCLAFGSVVKLAGDCRAAEEASR